MERILAEIVENEGQKAVSLWIKPENGEEKLAVGTLFAEGAGAEKAQFCSVTSEKHQVFFCELRAETQCMQLSCRFVPAGEKSYVNYNIGGVYFEEDLGAEELLLIGKAAVHTDGFPKGEEDRLTVKNASRFALYVMLMAEDADAQVPAEEQPPEDEPKAAHTPESLALLAELTGEKEPSRMEKILKLQMELNRYFVTVEGLSAEELEKA